MKKPESGNATSWSLVTGGDGVNSPVVADVSDALGQPALVVANVPSYVRCPDTGEKLKVIDVIGTNTGCPMCNFVGKRQTLVLEKSIFVFWCTDCEKYLFFSRRGKGETT